MKESLDMIVNFRLKELRESKGLTQAQLAKIINLNRTTYNHYEVQENMLPLKHLNFLANYFDVSIDYILGLTEVKKYENTKDAIDMKKSGEVLKEFRKSKNLTQVELANQLCTFHTVVVDYEKGKNFINTTFLYAICDKYRVSADYLLGKVENDYLAPKKYQVEDVIDDILNVFRD